MKFFINDKDNDMLEWNYFYIKFGGWWYEDCVVVNFNGNYIENWVLIKFNVYWCLFKGDYFMKFMLMKVRWIIGKFYGFIV